MANQKRNFPKLANLIVSMALLITIASSCNLNEFVNLPEKTLQVSETSTKQATSSPQPSETPTAQPSSTPTVTLTPEKSYNLVNNPDNASQMSLLTLVDTKGDYAKWVRRTCIPQITMDPSKIKFLVNYIPSANTNFLTANLSTNSYENGYYAAKNVQLCDRNIARINPSEFGLQNKNDIFIIPYIWEDSIGTRVVFQFSLGTSGLEVMKQNGAFSDKNGKRLSPADQLGAEHSIYYYFSGKPGGADDVRALTKGKVFYEAQGISEQEVLDLFKRIEETGVFTSADQNTIESLVFLSLFGAGPSSNQ